jgi:hypothetical protein
VQVDVLLEKPEQPGRELDLVDGVLAASAKRVFLTWSVMRVGSMKAVLVAAEPLDRYRDVAVPPAHCARASGARPSQGA